MSAPCVVCTHGPHEHDGRCFAAAPAGKAKPCQCDACADAARLYGLRPRCGCLAYAPMQRKEGA